MSHTSNCHSSTEVAGILHRVWASLLAKQTRLLGGPASAHTTKINAIGGKAHIVHSCTLCVNSDLSGVVGWPVRYTATHWTKGGNDVGPVSDRNAAPGYSTPREAWIAGGRGGRSGANLAHLEAQAWGGIFGGMLGLQRKEGSVQGV